MRRKSELLNYLLNGQQHPSLNSGDRVIEEEMLSEHENEIREITKNLGSSCALGVRPLLFCCFNSYLMALKQTDVTVTELEQEVLFTQYT